MLILMRPDATKDDISKVCDRIRELGFTPNQIPGQQRVAIGITGNEGAIDPGLFAECPGIAEAVAVSRPFKLASREVKPDDTVIRVGEAQFGGGAFGVVAGPCAVESHDQLMASARAVKKSGARMLRGGAFKPRTSPYSFQGLKEEGLKLLATAREATDLAIVTEVVATEDVDLVARYAD